MVDATLTERYRAARNDPTLAVLEGLHALKHALRFDADVMDVRTRDPDALAALARELAPDVADEIVERAQPLEPAVFDDLAPAAHPTGVIALARRAAVDLAGVLAGPDAPVVLLERPTRHGNIGAVIRVAAAAGAAGVLVTGRHDPWHPASIRGAAGLQYALPVASLAPDGLDGLAGLDGLDGLDGPAGLDGLDGLAGQARPVVVLDPEGAPLVDAGGSLEPIPARSVLAFGSERAGVGDALLARADRRVAIPMRPGVSSLNLATAVAITLYAAGGWQTFPGG